MNPRGENKSNVQKPTINIVPDVLPWTQGVSHAPAVPAWPRIEKKHENSSTQSQHQAPDFVNLVSYSVPYTDNLAPVSLKHQNTISIGEYELHVVIYMLLAFICHKWMAGDKHTPCHVVALYMQIYPLAVQSSHCEIVCLMFVLLYVLSVILR